ncbi:hypothetical protein OS493_017712 [Desmophyllum pertusum]|uniref:Uncharacterized protein n=1 Tax=Desmophyllum pertusum TaxID=174260 RepID=A0A9W9ZEP3_9CNID|nr:hypothetical protein OS493_017712 [Desmophyllum pertusum]
MRFRDRRTLRKVYRVGRRLVIRVRKGYRTIRYQRGGVPGDEFIEGAVASLYELEENCDESDTYAVH